MLAAAEGEFRALADAYPTYSGPLLNLGILQAKAGRFEDAEKTLRGAVERNGNNAQAFNQLGIVYRKLGRFKEADKAYQRAVQIDPNYAIAYLNLGVLCDLYLQQPRARARGVRALSCARRLAGREGQRLGHRAQEADWQRAAKSEGANDVQCRCDCIAGCCC